MLPKYICEARCYRRPRRRRIESGIDARRRGAIVVPASRRSNRHLRDSFPIMFVRIVYRADLIKIRSSACRNARAPPTRLSVAYFIEMRNCIAKRKHDTRF